MLLNAKMIPFAVVKVFCIVKHRHTLHQTLFHFPVLVFSWSSNTATCPECFVYVCCYLSKLGWKRGEGERVAASI